MNLKISTLLLTLISLMFGFNSCSSDLTETSSPGIVKSITKSAFNGTFSWDSINEITTYNDRSEKITLSLPWTKGNTQNIGIPQEWLDPNAESPDLSMRLYARAKGWVLVYSNLNQKSSSKYFALYNQYTGLLRFFLYEISQASDAGTSTSFWGIASDKPSSLFNFAYGFAKGQDEIVNQPSQITTPPGSFTSNSFSSVGYKANNWYGIELECAYDPTIKSNSGHNFLIKGWAANTITISGTAVTGGTIAGKIKTVAPQSSSFNLSLSNLFNNNITQTSTVTIGNSIGGTLGKTVDDGVKKNDPFFKSIWNNFKTNASKWISSGLESGLEKGVSAIISSGGSAVADALSSLVSSFIGSKKQETVSTVDLILNANTQIQLTGETPLVGWGQISAFPIPASTTNVNDVPLYNSSLGVWNLKATPYVTVNMYTSYTWLPISVYGQYKYILNTPEIVLNPDIASKFNIESIKYNLIVDDNFISMKGFLSAIDESVKAPVPYSYINETKLYNNGVNSYISRFVKEEEASFSGGSQLIKYTYVQVSFRLVDKNNSDNIYYFSKYFATQAKEGVKRYKTEVYPQGNGKLLPFTQY